MANLELAEDYPNISDTPDRMAWSGQVRTIEPNEVRGRRLASRYQKNLEADEPVAITRLLQILSKDPESSVKKATPSALDLLVFVHGLTGELTESVLTGPRLRRAVWEEPSVGESENASEVHSHSSFVLTGQVIADARRELWQSTSVEEALNVTRNVLSTKLIVRLAEMQSESYDSDQGEGPLFFDSVRWFIDYCLRTVKKKQPIITATPDGVMQGDWHKDNAGHVTIRFFPNGLAWVSIQTAMIRGSFEVPTQLLLTEQSPVRIPKWAR